MMGTSGKELFPRAEYTHCRSHALNLVVMHGCSDLPLVRNTMKHSILLSHRGQERWPVQEKGYQEKLGSHLCQTLDGVAEQTH